MKDLSTIKLYAQIRVDLEERSEFLWYGGLHPKASDVCKLYSMLKWVLVMNDAFCGVAMILPMETGARSVRPFRTCLYIYTHTYICVCFCCFFSLSLSSFSVSCVVSYMNRTWCRRRRICVVRCRQCRIACCASSLPSITATLSWERGRTRNKASWGLADLQRFVQHLTEEITAGPKEKGSPVQKEISE